MDTGSETAESSERFAAYHRARMKDVAVMRSRLAENDSRLRRLESGRESGPSRPWESVLDDTDLLIGAVASWEFMHETHGVDQQIHDQMQKVIDRFPGYTEEKIGQMADQSPGTKGGYINHLQGYLAEGEIADMINSGALPAPHGYHAVLSGATNEPGVDFRLVDGHGHSIAGQCKVGMSKSMITDHFLHHPQVPLVITNSELARQFAHDSSVTVLHAGDSIPAGAHHIVMDSGLTRDHFRDVASDFVNHSGHMASHESLWRKLPWVSAVIIALRSAHEYTYTDTPGGDIARTAWRRLRDIVAARGAGEGLDVIVPGDHSGFLSIVSLLTINSFRVAKGNFTRSTDLARATRTFLTRFGQATPATA